MKLLLRFFNTFISLFPIPIFSFSLKQPTVVSKHSDIPSPLVPSLDITDILVKPLPLPYTESSQVFRKIVCQSVKMNLQAHFATFSSVNFLTTSLNDTQASFSFSFIVSSNEGSVKLFLMSGPVKTTSFNFVSDSLRNCVHKY